MTNLDSIALVTDEARDLELVNPQTDTVIRDAKGMPATISLFSDDSDPARKAKRAAQTKQLAKRNRGKVSAEEIEENALDLLVAVTTGWSLLTFEGEKIDYPFTPENARALYSNSKFAWIREQADAFVGERAGFMQTPKST